MYVFNVASATDELYDMNDPDPRNLAHLPEHREALRWERDLSAPPPKKQEPLVQISGPEQKAATGD